MLMRMETDTVISRYLSQKKHASPLATFRIAFGILMVISMIRFWYNGWIEKLYILPDFHFKYCGFSWISVPDSPWIYGLFLICGLSALSVAVGFKYRWSIIIFFLSFTYIELMDKTTYLNHYYFVSVLSFMMIWLPMARYFSVDARKDKSYAKTFVPSWTVDAIKVLLALVYIYAGAAKLNHDWMLRAMPLTIWLPTKVDIPVIGYFMNEKWMHYLFSWSGAIYDLLIPFLLLYRRTRIFAFVMVLVFHILTRILFPIGMFPYIMILATLIFFDTGFHHKIIRFISSMLQINLDYFDSKNKLIMKHTFFDRFAPKIIIVLLISQLLIPLRYLAYPGNIFWTEEGYRFSWRVMLMEKTGYANFKIVDGNTGKRFYVQNEDFLTPFQQKQMSTQPDFIIQYAHYLGDHFSKQGHRNVEVYVESYASLNGRKSQPFIDPEVDLMKIEYNLKPKDIIFALHE